MSPHASWLWILLCATQKRDPVIRVEREVSVNTAEAENETLNQADPGAFPNQWNPQLHLPLEASGNLLALSEGKPLQNVVRNASATVLLA